jgi:ribose transport system permease protein
MRSISILGILSLGMGLIVISRDIDLSMISIMAATWSIPLVQIEHGMPIGWAVVLSIFR